MSNQTLKRAYRSRNKMKFNFKHFIIAQRNKKRLKIMETIRTVCTPRTRTKYNTQNKLCKCWISFVLNDFPMFLSYTTDCANKKFD